VTALYNQKSGISDKIFMFIVIVFLTLFAFVCVYPFYYIFIGSISSPQAISRGVFLFPVEINFHNYITIFETPGMLRSFFISVSRTVIGTTLTVFCSTFVAYIFSYKEVPVRSFLYRFFIITMYIGAGFVPYFMLLSNLNLLNTFRVYVIPSAISAYFIILTKAYMDSLPSSMREAAEIDGAGIVRIFFSVIAPLCKPIIACLIVFAAVGQWNAWADTLYFVRDPDLFPMQFRLYRMLQNNMADAMRTARSASAAMSAQQRMTPAALRLTMTFLTTMPILVVYPFMQRYFVKGLMLGAVKG